MQIFQVDKKLEILTQEKQEFSAQNGQDSEKQLITLIGRKDALA